VQHPKPVARRRWESGVGILDRNSVEHLPSCQVYRLLSFVKPLDRASHNDGNDDGDGILSLEIS